MKDSPTQPLSSYTPREQTVVLVGNSLCHGGAERQLVGLAQTFAAHGWKTHSLSLFQTPNAPSYESALKKCGVRPLRAAQEKVAPALLDQTKCFLCALPKELREAMVAYPRDLAQLVAQTAAFFLRTKPSLVIAYLDWPSTIAGLAAQMVGVPKTVVSARSHPPTLFPHFYKPEAMPFFLEAYRYLAKRPSIILTNNGLKPCAAYAKWIGIPQKRVAFVPNGLAEVFQSKPPAADIKHKRRHLALAPNDLVMLGVFRLSAEKRPQKFLELFEKCAKLHANLHAVLCGDGPLREKLEGWVRKKKLESRVHLLGNIEDTHILMAGSALLVHTSSYEGMPNVMMEAQAMGLPIVCARVGGTEDVLAPALRPYSFSKSDWSGMEKACLTLLKNKERRKKLGAEARAYVKKTFSMRRVISSYLSLSELA